MKISKNPGKNESSDIENPYFDIQAEIGMTKHGGGRSATDELANLCKINKDKYVLDVGCGVGSSACYIAKKYGCRVVGIDISEKMIKKAREKAARSGLESHVEFRVANAQSLPFEDECFDVVIGESLTAFLPDKCKGIREYSRVLKKGGYVGLNEITWVTGADSTAGNYMKRAMGGVVPETRENWIKLLEAAGFNSVTSKYYDIKIFRQWLNEVRGIYVGDYPRFIGRFISLLLKSQTYRVIMKNMALDSIAIPKNFFESWGYGIYVGRK